MDESKELAQGLAAVYALGALDSNEIGAFEEQLRLDPALRAEVAIFQGVAADLAQAAPFLRPAPRVKDGLFARIAQELRTPAGVVKRAGESDWIQTPFPGVSVKRLFVDPVTGMITTLLRAAAGSVYPAHSHGGLEQVYVVDGDMIFDDHALDTGDYEVSQGHTQHSAIRTTEGCLALIIHSPDDKILSSSGNF